jgi:polysaccharide export outer membrane protein
MALFGSVLLAFSLAQQPASASKPTLPAVQTLPPFQSPSGPAPRLDPAKGDQNTRYTLGPQDQLRITVFDEPELTNSYRIDSDGFITFPMINKVAASGITPPELQDRIRSMLASGYIRNPQVRVEVEGYKSQSVIVSGEVRTPGKLVMTGSMSLVEALAAAGSPTSAASNEVSVSRQRRLPNGTVPDENDVEIIRVNLKLLQLGQAGRDLQLQDGDLVNVPKALTFFITGQVRNSGSLVWEPGMTVQQAVALAGGLTDRGSDRRIKADRITPDGKVVEVSLHLEDKIQPNDTIKVSTKIF